jgi:hypothetical protein
MPKQSFSGLKSRSHRVLVPVLEKWIELQDQLYSVLAPDNAPWWYNERASIGTFAAAVWLSQGVAFEEYVTYKHVKNSKSLGGGRGDIFFRLGKSEFRGEAKQIWGKLRGTKQQLVIERNLMIALEDSKRRPADDKASRIGMLFVTPNLPSSDKRNIDERIGSWVKSVTSIPNCACAWHFPEHARGLEDEDENKVYPGCALFIRGEN